mmetsp:Transcript_1527/g.1608  ORF Transcript_1527/g.1608 Transcript_1527/m.1608 type:complete len:336 (+) Transcript_1527:14-1021(+)
MDVNLIDLIKEYDQYTADGKTPSHSWLSKLLKELRKSKIRRPDIVLAWGPKVLSQENYIEVWNLREQIAIAAIELNDLTTAETVIEVLQRQFPKSIRVSRLQGMLLEAQEKYSEALEKYDTILKEDITDIFARKRKVCIYKAKNDIHKTIAEINSILHYFPNDIGSWLELSELYLLSNDYEPAIHCYEELILLEPRNAFYHCRLAEIFYSIGGTEKILLARKYYTISLTCQNISYNLRAVTGLIQSCKQLRGLGRPYSNSSASLNEKKRSSSTEVAAVTSSSSSSSSSSQLNEHELKVNEELLKWSEDELNKFLSEGKKTSNEQLEVLKNILFVN